MFELAATDRAMVWGSTQLGTTSICFRGLGADHTHFFFPCRQTAGPSSVFACGFRRMVYALKGEGTGPRSRLLLSGSSVLERRVLGRGRVAAGEMGSALAMPCAYMLAVICMGFCIHHG